MRLRHLHRLIHGGIDRHLIHEKDLIRADAENIEQQRLELFGPLRQAARQTAVKVDAVLHHAVGNAAGKGCVAAGKPVPLEHLLERAVDPRAVPAAGRQRVQRRFSCTVDSHRRPPRRFPERLRKIKT